MTGRNVLKDVSMDNTFVSSSRILKKHALLAQDRSFREHLRHIDVQEQQFSLHVGMQVTLKFIVSWPIQLKT